MSVCMYIIRKYVCVYACVCMHVCVCMCVCLHNYSMWV